MKKTIFFAVIAGVIGLSTNAFALSWSCHVKTSSGLKSFSVDEPTGDEARAEARRRVNGWYPSSTIYSVECS